MDVSSAKERIFPCIHLAISFTQCCSLFLWPSANIYAWKCQKLIHKSMTKLIFQLDCNVIKSLKMFSVAFIRVILFSVNCQLFCMLKIWIFEPNFSELAPQNYWRKINKYVTFILLSGQSLEIGTTSCTPRKLDGWKVWKHHQTKNLA